MTGYNLTLNYTTASEAIRDVNANMPETMGFVLLFIFFFIVMAGVISSKRNNGTVNVIMWFAIAGAITSILSFFLFLADVLPTEIMIVTLIVTFCSILVYFLTPDDGF